MAADTLAGGIRGAQVTSCQNALQQMLMRFRLYITTNTPIHTDIHTLTVKYI